MGTFFRIVRAYLAIVGLPPRRLEPLFEAKTLDEQRWFYDRYIRPRLWSTRMGRLGRNRAILYLSGLHIL